MESVIIGIAGGTGSGKSTFTNRLKRQFGESVTVIYHDNYYRRQENIPFEERKKVNYDHPDSLETELLLEHLKQLKEGYPIDCPIYDYTQHNRSEKTVRIHPSPIIIVEGILLLADKRLRDLFDIKVYVDADADERILRRISRDMEERGRDFDNIMEQYLTTVKPMHNLFVRPTRAMADIVLNSGRNDVAFDLFQAKIKAILEEAEKENKERERIRS
ncbi:MAG: uridine kinase [Lachnospiraceae bacterium]|nr:uridine kinase [Lachnospiraceae bacterium]